MTNLAGRSPAPGGSALMRGEGWWMRYTDAMTGADLEKSPERAQEHLPKQNPMEQSLRLLDAIGRAQDHLSKAPGSWANFISLGEKRKIWTAGIDHHVQATDAIFDALRTYLPNPREGPMLHQEISDLREHMIQEIMNGKLDIPNALIPPRSHRLLTLALMDSVEPARYLAFANTIADEQQFEELSQAHALAHRIIVTLDGFKDATPGREQTYFGLRNRIAQFCGDMEGYHGVDLKKLEMTYRHR